MEAQKLSKCLERTLQKIKVTYPNQSYRTILNLSSGKSKKVLKSLAKTQVVGYYRNVKLKDSLLAVSKMGIIAEMQTEMMLTKMLAKV